MPEMVEDTHEKHDIELAAELMQSVCGERLKFDVVAEKLRGKSRLLDGSRLFPRIHAGHVSRAEFLDLQGKKTGAASHVET